MHYVNDNLVWYLTDNGQVHFLCSYCTDILPYQMRRIFKEGDVSELEKRQM